MNAYTHRRRSLLRFGDPMAVPGPTSQIQLSRRLHPDTHEPGQAARLLTASQIDTTPTVGSCGMICWLDSINGYLWEATHVKAEILGRFDSATLPSLDHAV